MIVDLDSIKASTEFTPEIMKIASDYVKNVLNINEDNNTLEGIKNYLKILTDESKDNNCEFTSLFNQKDNNCEFTSHFNHKKINIEKDDKHYLIPLEKIMFYILTGKEFNNTTNKDCIEIMNILCQDQVVETLCQFENFRLKHLYTVVGMGELLEGQDIDLMNTFKYNLIVTDPTLTSPITTKTTVSEIMKFKLNIIEKYYDKIIQSNITIVKFTEKFEKPLDIVLDTGSMQEQENPNEYKFKSNLATLIINENGYHYEDVFNTNIDYKKCVSESDDLKLKLIQNFTEHELLINCLELIHKGFNQQALDLLSIKRELGNNILLIK